jgi:hypothetical protein
LSWDVDPDDPSNNHLIVANVGLHTWETVDIIHKGANYGYAARRNETLADNTTGPHPKGPNADRLPIQITDAITAEHVPNIRCFNILTPKRVATPSPVGLSIGKSTPAMEVPVRR